MSDELDPRACDGCGELHPSTPYGHPAGGWTLPFDLFGYYDGFSDNVAVLFGKEEPESFWICHSCVLRLLELFPALAERLGGGHHPVGAGEPPCCRHAWRPTKIFGRYIDGQPAPGAHAQEAWPDGVWRDAD